MQGTIVQRNHPQLKQLVAEASHALARLDAGRLEELALSCQALNRDLASPTPRRRLRIVRESREAVERMAVFARVLEVTRSNLLVLERIRELRAGRCEYSEAQARGWARPENLHGDN